MARAPQFSRRRGGARRLGLGLSEAVRRLEARLGVRLLNRTTRSVTPTEAGAQLLERLAPALGEVSARDRRGAQVSRQPDRDAAAQRAAASSHAFLAADRRAFPQAHPGIAVEVTAEDSFIDVLAAGFDAGVRYDERLEQDMIAVPIGPRVQRFAVAAAPRLSCGAWPAGASQGPARSRLHPPPLPKRRTPDWEFENAGSS